LEEYLSEVSCYENDQQQEIGACHGSKQSHPGNDKIAYSRKMGQISWLEMFFSFKMVSMSSVSSTELNQAARKF